MRQKPPVNEDLDDDQILWQRVTQQVTRLPSHQQSLASLSVAKKTVKPAYSPTQAPQNTTPPALSLSSTVRTPCPVDLRQGDRAGLDGRTQRRLFRGEVPIERRLDLHGYTLARAEVKLHAFIEDAACAECRCVLVITGKGSGVLRSHVPRWLKFAPLSGLILALAEARPIHGGSGAFYIFLKRKKVL